MVREPQEAVEGEAKALRASGIVELGADEVPAFPRGMGAAAPETRAAEVAQVGGGPTAFSTPALAEDVVQKKFAPHVGNRPVRGLRGKGQQVHKVVIKGPGVVESTRPRRSSTPALRGQGASPPRPIHICRGLRGATLGGS